MAGECRSHCQSDAVYSYKLMGQPGLFQIYQCARNTAGSQLTHHMQYMGANVPGKKREFLLYMGGIPRWWNACEDALQNWKGFDLDARGSPVFVESKV